MRNLSPTNSYRYINRPIYKDTYRFIDTLIKILFSGKYNSGKYKIRRPKLISNDKFYPRQPYPAKRIAINCKQLVTNGNVQLLANPSALPLSKPKSELLIKANIYLLKKPRYNTQQYPTLITLKHSSVRALK